MKLFSKRTESKSGPVQHALSKVMNKGYERLQGGWANWMRKHTENFSRRTWFVLLLLFVLSASSYSFYLAVKAIRGKEHTPLMVTSIKKPEHTTKTGSAPADVAKLSEAEYSRIKKFRGYMDSLAQSDSGKLLYDSLNIHRPGLMDSVRFLETYYEQLKK